MTNTSLGLIETIGLAAAIEAADAALKSANVILVGYELTRGDGMTVVKVQGEVGAVNAAVAAGVAAAARVNRVAFSRVFARPARGIEKLVVNADTVGSQTATRSCRQPCVPGPVIQPESKETKSDSAPSPDPGSEHEPQLGKEAIEENSSDTSTGSTLELDARTPESVDSLAKEKVQVLNLDGEAAAPPPILRTRDKSPITNRKNRKPKE